MSEPNKRKSMLERNDVEKVIIREDAFSQPTVEIIHRSRQQQQQQQQQLDTSEQSDFEGFSSGSDEGSGPMDDSSITSPSFSLAGGSNVSQSDTNETSPSFSMPTDNETSPSFSLLTDNETSPSFSLPTDNETSPSCPFTPYP